MSQVYPHSSLSKRAKALSRPCTVANRVKRLRFQWEKAEAVFKTPSRRLQQQQPLPTRYTIHFVWSNEQNCCSTHILGDGEPMHHKMALTAQAWARMHTEAHVFVWYNSRSVIQPRYEDDDYGSITQQVVEWTAGLDANLANHIHLLDMAESFRDLLAEPVMNELGVYLLVDIVREMVALSFGVQYPCIYADMDVEPIEPAILFSQANQMALHKHGVLFAPGPRVQLCGGYENRIRVTWLRSNEPKFDKLREWIMQYVIRDSIARGRAYLTGAFSFDPWPANRNDIAQLAYEGWKCACALYQAECLGIDMECRYSYYGTRQTFDLEQDAMATITSSLPWYTTSCRQFTFAYRQHSVAEKQLEPLFRSHLIMRQSVCSHAVYKDGHFTGCVSKQECKSCDHLSNTNVLLPILVGIDMKKHKNGRYEADVKHVHLLQNFAVNDNYSSPANHVIPTAYNVDALYAR